MIAFLNLIKHKYFKVAAVVSLVLLMPLFLISSQQQQDQRSKASDATTLSFSPASSKSKPINVNVGSEYSVDVVLDPGINMISLLKLDINYDQTKMELSPENPITINKEVFPEVLEGPVYTEGRVQVALSIGSNQTMPVKESSQVLTLNFSTRNSTNRTMITFGNNNAAFSIGKNDASDEDVISSMTPAYVKIIKNTGKDKNKPNR